MECTSVGLHRQNEKWIKLTPTTDLYRLPDYMQKLQAIICAMKSCTKLSPATICAGAILCREYWHELSTATIYAGRQFMPLHMSLVHCDCRKGSGSGRVFKLRSMGSGVRFPVSPLEFQRLVMSFFQIAIY